MIKIGAALAAGLDILTATLDETGADVLNTLSQLGVDVQAGGAYLSRPARYR